MESDGVIARSLKATDELCHRWASQALDWEGRKTSSTFRACQAAAGVLLEPGHPPAMAEDVAILAKLMVELEKSRDDRWIYLLCSIHYGEGGSSDQKARRLGITRTVYYDKLRVALSYLRGRLKERGLEL